MSFCPPACLPRRARARSPLSSISGQGAHWQCLTDGHKVLLNQVAMGLPGTFIKPSVGGVEFPMASRSADRRCGGPAERPHARGLNPKIRNDANAYVAVSKSPDSLQVVSGQVGRGVRRVTFVLKGGAHVRATIGHDWYLAWWPTNNRKLYANAPASILVTTARGTSNAPYSASRLLRYFRESAS